MVLSLQSVLGSERLAPILLTIVTVIVVSAFKSYRHRRLLPPGPPGLPVLGNLHQIPRDAWVRFSQWKEQYGDIVYLNLLGRDVLVINSMKVAHELLDKRAAIYSDRPSLIVACDMLTEGMFLTFSRYGERWRRFRRAAHEGLHKGVVQRFRPIHNQQTLLLLKKLLDNPAGWELDIQKSLACTLLAVTYSSFRNKIDESVLDDIFEFTVKIVHAAFLDGFLVEYLPWIRHLPSWLMKWKRETLASSFHYSQLWTRLFRETRERVLQGDEHASLSALFVENEGRFNLDEKQTAWLTGTLATASETISGTMSWFFLEMAMHPDIQARAQKELDDVVGQDRLPSFADYQHLPYIQAIVKEVLRCHPVGPLGMQHRLIEDDIYEGYLIPKGTICVANLWAMNREPELYGPDASEFKPERHMLNDPPEYSKQEGHVSFGFGRRICLGRHLANEALFMSCSSILWMFRISSPKDENGADVPLSDESLTQGLVVHPHPYKYTLTPRFPDAVTILEGQLELEADC